MAWGRSALILGPRNAAMLGLCMPKRANNKRSRPEYWRLPSWDIAATLIGRVFDQVERKLRRQATSPDPDDYEPIDKLEALIWASAKVFGTDNLRHQAWVALAARYKGDRDREIAALRRELHLRRRLLRMCFRDGTVRHSWVRSVPKHYQKANKRLKQLAPALAKIEDQRLRQLCKACGIEDYLTPARAGSSRPSRRQR